jgi:transcriptional regulator GlxA family with amidase domain
MQNVLQVDSQFPGNRQLKVWLPGHPQIDRRIRVVVEHLHANLCMRISVADLARSVNMSRWHFCHLFKAEMSQSPSHYMRTLKMGEAQRMLLETFLSVKEIRATLGNIDRSHFSREFRNFCGLTPTEFRKHLTKQVTNARSDTLRFQVANSATPYLVASSLLSNPMYTVLLVIRHDS